RLINALLRLLRMLFSVVFSAVSPAQAQSAMQSVVAFHKPQSLTPEPMPDQQEIEETYDFHKMVSSLGDFPLLQRALGLVVDLTVTLEEPLPAGVSTVRVSASLPLQMAATAQVSMKVHYELEEGVFRARPRPASPEVS